MFTRGVTLIEMLVGLLTTVVISIAVFTFTMFYYNFINRWSNYNSSVVSTNAIYQNIGNSIKNAQPCFLQSGIYGSVLDSASNNSVTYYGDNCQKFQVFLSNGTIYKRDVAAAKNYIVSNDVTSLSFVYYLAGSDAPYSSLSSNQLKSVKEVELITTNTDNKSFSVKYRMRNSPQ